MNLLTKQIRLTLVLLFVLFITNATNAQSNSFDHLKPGKNKVEFKSEGLTIKGHLFLPANYNAKEKFPAIVIVTPAGGVKEQTAGIYAQKLSAKGYITLAFDHRTFGESEGRPRAMENAPMKVEDIKNAISFTAAIPGVDKRKIAELGICSGAGYAIQTACFDPRIKSVASVSGFFDFIDYGKSGGTQYMYELSGDNTKQLRQQMQMAVKARQKYYETGEEVMITGIPPKGSEMGEFWERAADYYYNPDRGGSISTFTPKRSAMSLDTRYFFNATEHLDLLRTTPILAIAGDKAHTLYYSKLLIERAVGQKELHTVKGAHHFDMYDGEAYVTQAIDKLNEFYKHTLK